MTHCGANAGQEGKGGEDEPEVGTNVEKDAILTRVVHKFGAECWVAMETWRGQVRTRGVKALHPNIEKRAWTRTRPWPIWKRGRRDREAETKTCRQMCLAVPRISFAFDVHAMLNVSTLRLAGSFRFLLPMTLCPPARS